MFENKFKNFSLIIILIWVFFIVSLPLMEVKAQAGPGDFPNPLGTTDFSDIAENIIDWIINIGILIAIIMIVYSGLLFMTAAGNEEKITKARKALTWSLIGLAVLLTGRGFISIIQEILSS